VRVGCGVARARVALVHGCAVVARKVRRFCFGARVFVRPQYGDRVEPAIGAHQLATDWLGAFCRAVARAALLCDLVLGARAVESPGVRLAGIGVKVRPARVKAPVKVLVWRRRGGWQLRLWRRRKGARNVAGTLKGLGDDSLRRSRTPGGAIGGVGAQRAPGGLAYAQVVRVVNKRLCAKAAVLAHAVVGTGARVVLLDLARVFAKPARVALRGIGAHCGNPRALSAIATLGVTVDDARARSLTLGEGSVRWQWWRWRLSRRGGRTRRRRGQLDRARDRERAQRAQVLGGAVTRARLLAVVCAGARERVVARAQREVERVHVGYALDKRRRLALLSVEDAARGAAAHDVLAIGVRRVGVEVLGVCDGRRRRKGVERGGPVGARAVG
jgi:hypothetical protein